VNIKQPSTDASEQLFQNIAEVIQQAHQHVRQTVNQAMVQSYWQIGRLIVEHEQQGNTRAAYGKKQLQLLSKRLTKQTSLAKVSTPVICEICAAFISVSQNGTQ